MALQDKLTTKFQEALGDAQSLALGADNAYIEPVHLLAAMLRQDDGPRSLLARAGVRVARVGRHTAGPVDRHGARARRRRHGRRGEDGNGRRSRSGRCSAETRMLARKAERRR